MSEVLNIEQERAVKTTEGALLIIAGAGSGKTRVITHRIAYMLRHGIPQRNILALTFTNKAAREMGERVRDIMMKPLHALTLSTFHAFGVKILREGIERLGYRSGFSIYDESDKGALIRESAKELKLSAQLLDVYEIAALFSAIKTGRKNWNGENDAYKELYTSYCEGLKLYNAVDFDDLIMLPIRLFTEHPDFLAEYKERYKYVMVDEFQDTSHAQYALLHLIAERNVAVVGDDDQSIYGWRGADYSNITQFEADYPDVIEIKLEQNYRSTGTILEAANGVISHNTNRKGKRLWSAGAAGHPIEVFTPENESAEGSLIAESIAGIAAEERLKYDDFCVLMRTNSMSRQIEEALLELNIPYTMSGGTSFYERQEIKDIVSYLRVIANHDDDINLLRIINIPRRNVGRSTIAALSQIAKDKDCSMYEAVLFMVKDPSNLFSGAAKEGLAELADALEGAHSMLGGRGLSGKVRAFLEAIQYRDYLVGEWQKNEKVLMFKLKNMEALLSSINSWENNGDNFDPSLYNYLNRITLISRDDIDDKESKGKVSLMTIHAAKGLEFPVVFIAGAEEGLMPHDRSIVDGTIEEERRLFYVAITRARDKLIITTCASRRRGQSNGIRTPSRFLTEIPQNLIEYHTKSPGQKQMTEEEMHKGFEAMLSAWKKQAADI